jgi:hypothetical protein
MSSTSRRRATTSRRRITLAAGAILAGAAIPIAAAGTAWADDDTITVAQAEKDAKAGEQVDISINGKTIKDTCPTCTADSGTKGEHNVAIAIGAGSYATDDSGDKGDRAVASGGGFAYLADANDSKATATGADSSASVDTTSGAPADTHDVAVATGGAASEVDASYTTATATGAGSEAYVNAVLIGRPGQPPPTPLPVTHDRLVADGTDSTAYINDASDSRATATGGNNYAQINYTSFPASVDTRDVVTASGASSGADIEDASDSSNVVNNGKSYTIDGINDTHLVNGVVVPHLEMTPLTDVHVMPAMPMP